MSAVVAARQEVNTLAINEQELINVLRNSVYPGAKTESIKMVIAYCKAAKLDVLQKPVHIVPMQVSTGQKDSQGWDIKENRDVIMPGIGLYRTQASRTQQYAGISQPEYGEEVCVNLGGVDVTYPKWCSVTVEKLVGNVVRQFSAKEFWSENYATKSNKSDSPNAMWRKRPYAQIAKCAEAQALRKAFPEAVGAVPTAEEMEGKEFEGEVIDSDTGEIMTGKPQVSLPQSKSEAARQQREAFSMKIPQEGYKSQLATETVPEKHVETAQTIAPPAKHEGSGQSLLASAGEKNYITNKLKQADTSIEQAMDACGLTSFENLTADGFIAMKEYLADLSR